MNEVVKELLQRLLGQDETGQNYVKFTKTDDIALTINNLGGLSVLELHAILDEVMSQLSSGYGITPKRLIAGTLISSLNGLGFSVTLLKLNDETIKLLDQDTDAPGWVPATQTINSRSPDVQLCAPEPTSKLSQLSGKWNFPFLVSYGAKFGHS